MTIKRKKLRFNPPYPLFKGDFFILLFFLSITSKAQLGFSFLNIPNNAKINTLGGINVSIVGSDINLIASNPALLDTSEARQVGFSYSPYLAQSHLVNLNYSKNGRWAFQLQNLSYGNFQGTDDLGNLTESFSANDFFVGVTHSRKIENFSFGITSKLIGSFLESYNSSAVAFDLGGVFKHPKKELSIGLVAKNIGFIFNNYSTRKTSLPFDLQAGVTFKPQFMPIRFSFTGHHLYQFEIPNTNPEFVFNENGIKSQKEISFINHAFRHLVFGSEILIHKQFSLLLGYNILRKNDLKLPLNGGVNGLSFGGFLRIKKASISFSHARFVKSGTTFFTFNTNI
jgi:hypothetical protein